MTVWSCDAGPAYREGAAVACGRSPSDHGLGLFNEAAAREAYLAALHAALALILSKTGQTPKSHSGARSQFALLARDDTRIPPRFTAFLGRAYEFKTVADYDRVTWLSASDAERSIAQASEMVIAVEALVRTAT